MNTQMKLFNEVQAELESLRKLVEEFASKEEGILNESEIKNTGRE